MTSSDTPSQPGPTAEHGPEPTDKAHEKGQTQGRGEADDAASRASKPDVQHTDGSGLSGHGGASGGTPDAGGLGLPGGAYSLGRGPSGTGDAGEAGTPATGGMGASGHQDGSAAGDSGGEGENTPGGQAATTYGDTGPYRDNPDEAHRHGRLSVAGGSAGGGLESAGLDEAADVVRRENMGDVDSGHPTPGTTAG